MNPELRRVIKTWWPLAASWLLMAVEVPFLSAVIARLPNPEVNLAAYGGVVFPLALIIESPVIMLLPAATALSRDWASYQRIYRFAMTSGAALTALHLLIALTPLYSVVVEGVIGAPAEIVEPARLGLIIMTPWTWSIAYRRFNQGTMIRFGHSRKVGMGTAIRLIADATVLLGGFALARVLGPDRLPGIAVATAAVAAGVICDAIYAGIAVRPILRTDVRFAPKVDPPLTWSQFFTFYTPLMMTSLLTLISNPIGSAGLSRMPASLPSLAAYTVVTGFVFMLRSLGVAYNEVVVALLDEPRLYTTLRRFTSLLVVGSTGLLVLMTVTPLARLWFTRVSALNPELAELARLGLWFALPLPALAVLQSWYQGAILYGRRTRGITESVAIYLMTTAVVLGVGIALNRITGLYIGLLSVTLSMATQTAWLWLRARPVFAAIEERMPAVQDIEVGNLKQSE